MAANLQMSSSKELSEHDVSVQGVPKNVLLALPRPSKSKARQKSSSWEESQLADMPSSKVKNDYESLLASICIDPSIYTLRIPEAHERIYDHNDDDECAFYLEMFNMGFTLPPPPFIIDLMKAIQKSFAQLRPNPWLIIIGFLIRCLETNVTPTVALFSEFYYISRGGDSEFTCIAKKGPELFSGGGFPLKTPWKEDFFFIKAKDGWGFNTKWTHGPATALEKARANPSLNSDVIKLCSWVENGQPLTYTFPAHEYIIPRVDAIKVDSSGNYLRVFNFGDVKYPIAKEDRVASTKTSESRPNELPKKKQMKSRVPRKGTANTSEMVVDDEAESSRGLTQAIVTRKRKSLSKDGSGTSLLPDLAISEKRKHSSTGTTPTRMEIVVQEGLESRVNPTLSNSLNKSALDSPKRLTNYGHLEVEDDTLEPLSFDNPIFASLENITDLSLLEPNARVVAFDRQSGSLVEKDNEDSHHGPNTRDGEGTSEGDPRIVSKHDDLVGEEGQDDSEESNRSSRLRRSIFDILESNLSLARKDTMLLERDRVSYKFQRDRLKIFNQKLTEKYRAERRQSKILETRVADLESELAEVRHNVGEQNQAKKKICDLESELQAAQEKISSLKSSLQESTATADHAHDCKRQAEEKLATLTKSFSDLEKKVEYFATIVDEKRFEDTFDFGVHSEAFTDMLNGYKYFGANLILSRAEQVAEASKPSKVHDALVLAIKTLMRQMSIPLLADRGKDIEYSFEFDKAWIRPPSEDYMRKGGYVTAIGSQTSSLAATTGEPSHVPSPTLSHVIDSSHGNTAT